MSKIVFFIGLTILAVASARVTRDAPAPADLTLDNVFGAIQEGLKKMGNTVLSATGSADADELQKKTVAQLGVAQDRIKAWVEGAKEETEHLKDNPFVKDLRSAMEKLGSDFKNNHPTLATGVSDEIKKAQENVDEVVKKIKALEDSDEAKKFKETTDKLIESAKTQLEGLATELKAKTK